MPQLSPYINFEGQAKAALTFYQQCFGGELSFQTVGESPIADQFPEEMKPHIFHGSLNSGSISILASDLSGPEGNIKGNNHSLALMCDTEDEINSLFAKLSESGQVFQPLAKQFWGAIFGMFTDKFGVRWMLNCYVSE